MNGDRSSHLLHWHSRQRDAYPHATLITSIYSSIYTLGNAICTEGPSYLKLKLGDLQRTAMEILKTARLWKKNQ